MRTQKKRTNIKRYIIVVLLILFLWIGFSLYSSYNGPLFYSQPTTIQIKKWDTIAKFYTHLQGLKRTMMKLWLKNHSKLIPNLQEWTYNLDWLYTKQELLELIEKWPQQEYIRVTLLEWWSKYDIDNYLTNEGLAKKWDFIEKIEDQWFITGLKSDYQFLAILPQGKSLEWFLYPDTYFLDKNGVKIEQLIRAQLKNFNEKVWQPYANKLKVKDTQLSVYWIITLASIIENEEKLTENKPTIAWIFINRLNNGMRLDADVTLCYGLKIVYDKCRENIVANLYDASNLYNTRQNVWLTPTPISSPTVETILSLINYKKTKALYYLHDKQWKIHYANTIQEHNANKEKYL